MPPCGACSRSTLTPLAARGLRPSDPGLPAQPLGLQHISAYALSALSMPTGHGCLLFWNVFHDEAIALCGSRKILLSLGQDARSSCQTPAGTRVAGSTDSHHATSHCWMNYSLHMVGIKAFHFPVEFYDQKGPPQPQAPPLGWSSLSLSPSSLGGGARRSPWKPRSGPWSDRPQVARGWPIGLNVSCSTGSP